MSKQLIEIAQKNLGDPVKKLEDRREHALKYLDLCHLSLIRELEKSFSGISLKDLTSLVQKKFIELTQVLADEIVRVETLIRKFYDNQESLPLIWETATSIYGLDKFAEKLADQIESVIGLTLILEIESSALVVKVKHSCFVPEDPVKLVTGQTFNATLESCIRGKMICRQLKVISVWLNGEFSGYMEIGILSNILYRI